jgi:hypothetical protein
MYQLLERFPLVGFHPRAMGHQTPPGYRIDGRINAVQGINRRLVGKVKVDHYDILADIFLILELLTRGDENAIITDLFWDQVGTSNAPGGCSLHRTWEGQKAAVLGLAAMYPEFVTVRKKIVKTGWWKDEEGNPLPRYDFVVQWKKAAQYGARQKEMQNAQ